MEHYHVENKWPPTKSRCIRQNFGQSKASCTIIYAICYCLQKVVKHEKIYNMLIRRDMCNGAIKTIQGTVNRTCRINIHLWGSWWKHENVIMESQN